MTMGLTGSISKLFLQGLNNVEVVGLDKFVKLLESRSDPYERQRGLLTGTAPAPLTSLVYTHTHTSPPPQWHYAYLNSPNSQ